MENLVRHVLVTGANGFIGRNLCWSLVNSQARVTACIRATADASVLPDASRYLRIHRVPSLDSSTDLASAFEDVDAVIHLAGRAHIMHETAADSLREFRRVNVEETEYLASIAAQKSVKRFILMSSIKVNGEVTTGTPFCADDPPGFSDPYGQSKWEAEERLRHIATAGNMQWIVVRPPLVYGPGVKGNFLALLRWVFRRTPLPVGSLRNNRSLVSVFNLSDFLTVLLNHPRAANNRFVVADESDVSTPELVRRTASALHCLPRILPCPESVLSMAGIVMKRRAMVQRLCSSLVLDRQKTKDLLGWSAPTTLSWGLERTAEWFLSSASSGGPVRRV